MRLRTSSSITTALAALSLLAGCSESGPETVPVYGTVTFVGRDAPNTCRPFFKPIKVEGLTRPTAAERSPNGSYSARAFSTSKGLLPGTYKIVVSYYDLVPGKNPELETSWAETSFHAVELVVDANSKGIEHNIEVPIKGYLPHSNGVSREAERAESRSCLIILPAHTFRRRRGVLQHRQQVPRTR